MKLNEILNEGLNDTSWGDGMNNITLKDILQLTKHIPVKEYSTKKLAPIVLKWNDNPEELARIDQTNLDYPILIMVDENNKIQWILDGHHRLQKAIKNNMPKIKVKLIRPSDLNDKARGILM